jgi:hypothetical protein
MDLKVAIEIFSTGKMNLSVDNRDFVIEKSSAPDKSYYGALHYKRNSTTSSIWSLRLIRLTNNKYHVEWKNFDEGIVSIDTMFKVDKIVNRYFSNKAFW